VLGVPGALLCVINIIFSTCVLFAIDWRLALGAMVGLPFCIIGPKILGPRALAVGHQLRGEQAALANIIQENLGAQQIVKAFSLKESVLASFAGQADRVVRLATRFNFQSYVTERSPTSECCCSTSCSSAAALTSHTTARSPSARWSPSTRCSSWSARPSWV
jgi:ABC-type multidrug transport system fused ATPase/permease subunit